MKYLSDEEMEKLIGDTEQNGMMKAPEYLETDIRQRISADNKKTLVFYSIKIMAAAAAAIIMLVFMPAAGVKMPDRGHTAIENINQSTYRLCGHINDVTDSMIIKEDR